MKVVAVSPPELPTGADGRDRRRRLLPPAGRISAPGAALLAVPFGGCAPTPAPAIPFIGAYFPSWLLCTLAGVVIAIVVRVVFVRIGLDDVLPARLLVYLGVATVAGLVMSTLVFGR
ncbi:YtcA family lipoprotein [Amorphus sp. MBR-141]